MPQTSGTIEVAGLSAPVRVARDRWGVPHIYAQTQDDLFFAQGFVQAQDRLFQMDLWRRSVQGRLSQVLGPNFIERDAMTRRVQYRGDLASEWASYGADTATIATAFVRGINAWVAAARTHPPAEFALAGWTPEYWSPIDVLNRTDAFLSSGDALDEVRSRRISEVVSDAVRRVGTPPFFLGLAASVTKTRTRSLAPQDDGGDVETAAQSSPSTAGHAAADRGGVLSFGEAHRFTEPSSRYLVHLHAPGWNVIGVTAPWLPGVAAGHNERIAWGMTALSADTQDVYLQGGMGGSGGMGRKVTEAIVVKGRTLPFAFETELIAGGVVIASDREHGRAYVLRWSGFEPGAAAELGALSLDRAANWAEFRAVLATWRMPARRFVYIDVDGNIGFQEAALVPRRRGDRWQGWTTLDELPHALNGRLIGAADSGTAPSVAATTVIFASPLGITPPARSVYNVGPIARPRSDDTVVRMTLDPRSWDRSTTLNAPGQSGSPESAHFADLAELWRRGAAFPLAFSDGAVEGNSEASLALVNGRAR